jgi:hypothetical protein
MGVAFAARLHAGLAAYAAIRVYEKFHVCRNSHLLLASPYLINKAVKG